MRRSVPCVMFMVLVAWAQPAALVAQAEPAKGAAPKDGKPAEEAPRLNVYAEMAKANKLANAGGYSRAVPIYERVVQADPDNYAVAHFNLGEIYKLRKKWNKAAFHYQAYLLTGRDEDTLKQARVGLRQCLQPTSATLEVRAAPEDAEIYVDGFLFARGGQLKPVQLPAGGYKVEARAIDHGPQARDIKLKDGEPQQLDFTLERYTFFGLLKIEVDQPGATIVVTPKELDKRDETAQAQRVSAPMSEPLKLATGKYYIEIERDGFDRWIRNVQVTRDGTTLVEVKMNKQVPEEIR